MGGSRPKGNNRPPFLPFLIEESFPQLQIANIKVGKNDCVAKFCSFILMLAAALSAAPVAIKVRAHPAIHLSQSSPAALSTMDTSWICPREM